MNETYLEKLPGIRDIVDDTEGGGIVLPRESKLILKGAVNVTPRVGAIELEFTGSSEPGGEGTGDVVGPASATANRLPVFADGTGKELADSGVLIGNVIRATGNVAFTGDQSMGGKSLTSVKRLTYVLYNGYGNSGSAKTIVAANGDIQRLLVTADCALTFTLGADPCSFTLIYEQNGGGGFTLTHPVGTVVIGAIASTGKTVANYLWDGTTLRVGFVGGAGGSGDWMADGSVTATGDFNLGGNEVTNAGDAGASTSLTTLQQVNALIAAAVAGAGGGGGDGFSFTFDTGTTDADPTAGKLKYNNATLASVTQIYVDLADVDGNDLTGWLDRLDDTFGSIKGYIRVGSKSNKTKWALFKLTALTTATGYRKLPVTFVTAGGGGLPTTSAGDTFLSFESLGLAALITDALVAVGAAIDGTKILPAFGNQAVSATATNGHSFGAAAASATILETFDVSGRTLLALLFGAAPTATELPASGGNRVVQFGESLSWPAVKPGGNALFTLGSHDTHGLGLISKNGVESTVAPNGNSASATRKLGLIRLHYYQTGIASTAEFSAIEADANGVNGAALPNGTYEISFTAICEQTAGSNLRHVVRASRLVKKQSGTLSTVGSVYLNTIAGDSSPPSVGTIDVDGTVIRGRVALASSTATNVTGYFEIRGTAP